MTYPNRPGKAHEPMYSIIDIAGLFQVDRSTVRRWVREKRIPGPETRGKDIAATNLRDQRDGYYIPLTRVSGTASQRQYWSKKKIDSIYNDMMSGALARPPKPKDDVAPLED